MTLFLKPMDSHNESICFLYRIFQEPAAFEVSLQQRFIVLAESMRGQRVNLTCMKMLMIW